MWIGSSEDSPLRIYKLLNDEFMTWVSIRHMIHKPFPKAHHRQGDHRLVMTLRLPTRSNGKSFWRRKTSSQKREQNSRNKK